MPLIGVEEIENALKGFIRNLYLRVVTLQVVHVEQAAVEIRNLAEQLHQFRDAVGLGLAQPFVKQPQAGTGGRN